MMQIRNYNTTKYQNDDCIFHNIGINYLYLNLNFIIDLFLCYIVLLKLRVESSCIAIFLNVTGVLFGGSLVYTVESFIIEGP